MSEISHEIKSAISQLEDVISILCSKIAETVDNLYARQKFMRDLDMLINKRAQLSDFERSQRLMREIR